MNDESCAASGKDGMRTVFQRDVRGNDCRLGPAFCVHGEIGDVAGVRALGILQAVMFAVGIEMTTSGFEVGAFTLGGLMDVDGVFAGREVLQVELYLQAVGS